MQCIICYKESHEESSYIILTAKGALAINNCCKSTNDALVTKVGDTVHISCRKSYTVITVARTQKASEAASGDIKTHNLRTDGLFSYKSNCLFCENPVTEREKYKKLGFQVISKNRDFDISILKICEERSDAWALSVKGRIAYVNDLHSEDAVYHQICSVNFRTGKCTPKKYERRVSSGSKRGRPSDINRETAFTLVANYLRDNDDGQITINDLITKMKEYLEEFSQDEFISKWIITRLKEYFKDDIVITEMNGKQNVVTFTLKSKTILHEFYESGRCDDSEEEKTRIIRTAAMLLKHDIKECDTSKITYPSIDDVESCKNYLPSSLNCFLEEIIVSKEGDLKIASIGQAIMQAVMPKALIAPLQIGLAVQMHRQFGSRFLIDSLYNHGFCSSYKETQRF